MDRYFFRIVTPERMDKIVKQMEYITNIKKTFRLF
uniref:Uncharacterized protein n=1 Tax=Arundo donax TaxID=35708 RepID=A0A0A9B1Z4_ARUDO